MDKEIASIMFMPVCTECWNIIFQEIDVQQSSGIVRDSPRLIYPKYAISPDKCPHCGALFNNITIPTKLPFDSYDYYNRMLEDD